MNVNDIARIACTIRSLDLGHGRKAARLRYSIAQRFVRELNIGGVLRGLFLETCDPTKPTMSEAQPRS